jgi:hypothetical protein
MNALTLNFTRFLTQVGFGAWPARGVAVVRAMGPYAAIELILPGGTVLALLLWLYRRHQRGEPLPPVVARSLSKLRLGVRRIVEAVRPVGRSSLGDRDVTVCVDTVCVGR